MLEACVETRQMSLAQNVPNGNAKKLPIYKLALFEECFGTLSFFCSML